jgi:hypothetical protein
VAKWSKALAGKVTNITKGVRGFDKINPSRRFEQIEVYGEVAERSKAHAWKVCNT